MTGSREPDPFRAFEADAWDRLPVRYGDFWSPITGAAIEPLRAAAAVGAGVRVLDVATGPARRAAE